jgi:hypothetical protein
MRKSKLISPPVERARECFAYDEQSGSLFWKPRGGAHRYGGKRAGTVNNHGYVRVKMDGKDYAAHRIIWAIVHGEIPAGALIDHINGDTQDNRLCNLRLATPSQNTANSFVSKRSKSGAKGCWYLPRTNRWQSQIRQNGVLVYLGTFKTKEEAEAAYQEAATARFGAYARFQQRSAMGG